MLYRKSCHDYLCPILFIFHLAESRTAQAVRTLSAHAIFDLPCIYGPSSGGKKRTLTRKKVRVPKLGDDTCPLRRRLSTLPDKRNIKPFLNRFFMAIINKETCVIVQGITGTQGSFHTTLMKEYGTNIVAGVTPGKAGQQVEGIPVFDSVADALKEHPAEFSIIFIPARVCKAACLEALDNGLNIVVITEGMPVHDALEVVRKAKDLSKIMIGPNCPGLIVPGEAKIGIMPSHIFTKGTIGVISRSGTLTYEIINSLTKAGLGQSTAIGIGGDAIIGTDFIEALQILENDQETEKIVLIGEIGGDAEERAAVFIKENVKKPVVAYITGRTAPEGKRMGHAGAVISGNTGTAKSKIEALQDAGVKVAELPSDIAGFFH